MLASYVLSRTLVPTLAMYWLRKHPPHEGGQATSPGLLVRLQSRFEGGFERLRGLYRSTLESVLRHRKRFIPIFLGLTLASFLLVRFLGSDFFPSVDSGQITLHVRAHAGLRVEETARLCDEVEDAIRRVIPAAEMASVVDNVGLPVSGINLSYSNSAPTTEADADILVSLREKHGPTANYVAALRKGLPVQFPGVTFAFLPADIVTQIINFGLPAPIDVQLSGFKVDQNRALAQRLIEKIRRVPGVTDARIQQTFDYPEFEVTVDRSRARDLGFSQLEVANDLLFSLSGSFQTQPTFWLDRDHGVSYSLIAQTPQYQLDSLDTLRNLPLSVTGGQQQILGAVSTITRGVGPSVVSHYNVAPAIDIYTAVQGRDLGAVSADIRRLLMSVQKDVPKGSKLVLRGQAQTMDTSFKALYGGLAFAIFLVYLLIVINFQSWTDAFIIITALPGALAGIVWMLFLTGTTLSVPALTGAIMCMGVATANSILVVSFARDRMHKDGYGAVEAALDAGFGRFRPVLMTALAMIIGMLPMAIGLGEGGEQNAPLGRAVIGGLCVATVATLLFVPAVFVFIHGRKTYGPPAPAAGPLTLSSGEQE
jgi:multidrug efflux pump subunit AcrB